MTLTRPRYPFDLAEQPFVDAREYGTTGDGVTDDYAAIQAALDTGKDVLLVDGVYGLSQGLVMSTSNQTLFGAGGGMVFDPTLVDPPATILSAAKTTLKALAGFTGTMLLVATPDTGTEYVRSGGGVRGIFFNGNSLADICLEVQSWRSGIFEDLSGYDYLEWGLSIGTVTNGVAAAGNVSSTENTFADITMSTFGILIANGFSYDSTAGGIVLWGNNNAGTIGNAALNRFYNIKSKIEPTGGGIAFKMEDSDANEIYGLMVNGANANGLWFGAFDTAGSNPKAVAGTPSYLARHNKVYGMQGGCTAEAATATGDDSHSNVIYGFSRGNGVGLVDIKTGAYLTVHYDGDATVNSGAYCMGGNPTMVHIGLGAAQTIPDSTLTDVLWASQKHSLPASYASWDATGVTVPDGCQWAKVTAGALWTSSGVGNRVMRLKKNGATSFDGHVRDERQAALTSGQSMASGWIAVVPGDKLTVDVYQSTGGPLDLLLNAGNFMQVEFK